MIPARKNRAETDNQNWTSFSNPAKLPPALLPTIAADVQSFAGLYPAFTASASTMNFPSFVLPYQRPLLW
jgi:hypothetical protein